jgi:hypothetical protein
MEGVRLLTPRFAAWGRYGNILACSDGVGWPAGWPMPRPRARETFDRKGEHGLGL